MLRQRNVKGITDFIDVTHNYTTMPISMAKIMLEYTPRKQQILAARKRIKDPSNDDNYIRMVERESVKLVMLPNIPFLRFSHIHQFL